MRSYLALAGLTLVLVLAAWLRSPFIAAGVPFLYLEDEAHHFQRTVQMVKTGSFNPDYFNKPSLHFYLRMPVVAAAFVASVKAGEIRRVDELVTRSPAPDGGWAFTLSHPRILIWNRTFGVVLGLIAVGLTFTIARDLTGDDMVAIAASLLAAVSPALAMDAAKVGVDTPMVMMCLLAMWLALRLHAHFTTGRLIAAGLVAGLAVSTKYNAAPIVVLPLLVCLMERRRTAGAVLLALVLPIAGFLLGTPFALIELPKFLNQMAFETWHYGTAGHGAATGEPGLPQAWFYLKWFASSRGLGLIAVVFAVAGLAERIRSRDLRSLTFLTFPALFFLLMAEQKVNFTRNVLVLLPVMAVLAVDGARALSARTRKPAPVAAIAIAVACLQPVIEAVTSMKPGPPDSRTLAARWLDHAAGPRAESVAASELAWPVGGAGGRRVTEVDTAQIDPLALYMSGYDHLIVDGSFVPRPADAELLREAHVVAGAKPGGRVVNSPEVRIFRLEPPRAARLSEWLQTPASAIAPEIRYGESQAMRAGDAERCSPDRGRGAAGEGAQGGCWVRARVTRIQLDPARARRLPAPGGALTLHADLLSPWPDQQCTFEAGAWRSADLCTGQVAGRWFTVTAPVPVTALADSALTLVVQDVHALTGDADKRHPARAGLIVGALQLR